jgi:serine/threonine protein kinase
MPVVAGFEIVRELGQGSGGRVYLARDAKLGRDVAIKALPDLFVDAPGRLVPFEARSQDA